MKHKLSITILLLSMFLLTQLIGIYVVNSFHEKDLPYGLETPEEDASTNFVTIIISFIFAFAIIFLLIKYQWKIVIRIWFFFVVVLALSIAIYAIVKNWTSSPDIIALIIAVPLAFYKIIRPRF